MPSSDPQDRIVYPFLKLLRPKDSYNILVRFVNSEDANYELILKNLP